VFHGNKPCNRLVINPYNKRREESGNLPENSKNLTFIITRKVPDMNRWIFLVLLTSFALIISLPFPGKASSTAFAQSSPTPASTGTAQEKITLTESQEQELQRLRRWYEGIIKYDNNITAFLNAYSQACAAKDASGFGSLRQAQPYVEEMKARLASLQSTVPDEMMRNGHMKFLSAFTTMLQCLVFTAPPENLQAQAQQDLVMAQNDLARWKADFNATRSRFIRNLGI
jgi:hypothetical protein